VEKVGVWKKGGGGGSWLGFDTAQEAGVHSAGGEQKAVPTAAARLKMRGSVILLLACAGRTHIAGRACCGLGENLCYCCKLFSCCVSWSICCCCCCCCSCSCSTCL
jgi:hypothetical protein